MPHQRLALITKTSDRLLLLARTIKARSRASLTDANHMLEHVMARFFNALFGWQLINLNIEETNYPAADLGDEALRIAIQITNVETGEKIVQTREKAVTHLLNKHFDKLIIFFLLERAPTTPKTFTQPKAGPEIEIWDIPHLVKKLASLNIDALEAASLVLDKEMGQNAAPPIKQVHTLPPRPNGFVGRRTELESLRALQPTDVPKTAMLAGLRGMGGIGKTALALMLAHDWSPNFPHGQLFLDGRGTQETSPVSAELIAQIIHTFDPEAKIPETEGLLRATYHNLLHDKRVLILLDNAKDAAQATPLIPPAGCAFIVTSRRGFQVGNSAPLNVGRMSDPEAIALLREFHSDINDPEATELVKLCAGLPLALRLVGAHIALDVSEGGHCSHCVASYIGLLRKSRLATLDSDAPEAGEVTISETLRLSEAMLTETDRVTWRKLSVFGDSFHASDAEAVIGVSDTILRSFVRRSLLERVDLGRYKLHDLATDYALARLNNREMTSLRLAHAKRYIEIALLADSLYMGGDATSGVILFDQEISQIEFAFKWLSGSITQEKAPLLLALLDAVTHIGNVRFLTNQRLSWLRIQLSTARFIKDDRAQFSAFANIGIVYKNIGEYRIAIRFQNKALTLIRKIGDKRAESVCLTNLGVAFKHLGDRDQAIAFYEDAAAIADQINDKRGKSLALGNAGGLYAEKGQIKEALDQLSEALKITIESGDRYGEGGILANIGGAYMVNDDLIEAIKNLEQSLTIFCEIGYLRGQGMIHTNLASAYDQYGDNNKSISHAEAALIIIDKTQYPDPAIVRNILSKRRFVQE